ncbi:MAG: hypothetical protein EOP56_07495 [Sphingobacteriales bacterium]|nr:MAG: hypothetical protein EOP56_07495 [Sphingobacteriales bacterium]
MRNAYQTHEYFVGKIAPFLLFELEFHSLAYLVESHEGDKHYPDANPASHVSFIGLVSYFEAFCKHQFAALVNIFPDLISAFALKRDAPKLEFSTVVSFQGENFKKYVGFVLAEHYDFGSAKLINGLYRDLLQITPFTKEEERMFNDILQQRNLLVHHAGYYTLKHFKGTARQNDFEERVFKDALKIGIDEYLKISDFIFGIAIKIARESTKAAKRMTDYDTLSVDHEKRIAVAELLKGIYDTLE